MDGQLRGILTRRFAAIRSRQRAAAVEAFLRVRDDFTRRGALGNSRFGVYLDKVAAEQLDERADEAFAEARRVAEDLDLPWTEDFGQSVASFLQGEIRKDADELRALAKDVGKAGRGTPIGSKVNDSEQRIRDEISTQVDLLVHREALHRQPLLDQLSAPRYEAVRAGVMKAQALLDSDPANAAKEAVSAVEQLARIVTGRPKVTLGDAIKTLRRDGRAPRPLLNGVEKLWAWASSHDGVRHGASGSDAIDEHGCRYVVRSSEAALQYLLEIDAGLSRTPPPGSGAV